MIDQILNLAVTNAIGATILALLVLIVVRFVRDPQTRHWLWLLVLVRLVLPIHVPVTFGLLPRVDSGAKATAERTVAATTIDPQPIAISPNEIPLDTTIRRIPFQPIRQKGNDSTQIAQNQSPLPSSVVNHVPKSEDVGFFGRVLSETADWKTIILLVWFNGTLLWSLIAFVRIVRFHFLVRRTKPAEQQLIDVMHRVATQLNFHRRVDLRVGVGLTPPFVWAIGRPKIVVPARMIDELDEQELSAVLAHELCHLRRRDHWVRWFEMLVLAIAWWHPIAWFAARKMREAEDEACDADVVRSIHGIEDSYARGLLKIVDWTSEQLKGSGANGAGHTNLPRIATGLGEEYSFKERIELMLSQATRPVLARWKRYTLLLVFAIVVPISVRLSAKDPETEKTTKPVLAEAPKPADPAASSASSTTSNSAASNSNEKSAKNSSKSRGLSKDKVRSIEKVTVGAPTPQPPTSTNGFGVPSAPANNFNAASNDTTRLSPISSLPANNFVSGNQYGSTPSYGGSTTNSAQPTSYASAPPPIATNSGAGDPFAQPYQVAPVANGYRPPFHIRGVDNFGNIVENYSGPLPEQIFAAIPATKLNMKGETVPLDRQEMALRERIIKLTLVVVNANETTQASDFVSAIRELTEIGEPATEYLTLALQYAHSPLQLSKLGYTLRAMGDKRAIPALIEALPRTFAQAGDEVVTLASPKLAEFANHHQLKTTHRKGLQTARMFMLCSPVREIAGAIIELSGIEMGEDELYDVQFEGSQQQMLMKVNLFQKLTMRRRGWWRDHASELLGAAQNFDENLLALIPTGSQITQSTEKTVDEMRTFIDQPKSGAFDLDTGRFVRAPKSMNVLTKDTSSLSREFRDWSGENGVDLVGAQIHVLGKADFILHNESNLNAAPPEHRHFVLRRMGLLAWEIDETLYPKVFEYLRDFQPFEQVENERERDVYEQVTREDRNSPGGVKTETINRKVKERFVEQKLKKLAIGRPVTTDYLMHWNEKDKVYDPSARAHFLFVTREGLAGIITTNEAGETPDPFTNDGRTEKNEDKEKKESEEKKDLEEKKEGEKKEEKTEAEDAKRGDKLKEEFRFTYRFINRGAPMIVNPNGYPQPIVQQGIGSGAVNQPLMLQTQQPIVAPNFGSQPTPATYYQSPQPLNNPLPAGSSVDPRPVPQPVTQHTTFGGSEPVRSSEPAK